MTEPPSEVRRLRRPAEVACGWCGTTVPIRPAGRVPKWCSSNCRHRAWEQRRAAESGLAAVEVVDRPVEVEVIKTVRQVEYVEMPIQPRGDGWAAMLIEFAGQLRTGRIYDRDLPALTGPLADALAAMEIRVRRHGAGR